MTAFAVEPDHCECVTLTCVEARRADANLVQQPGTRHSIRVGAPGVALLASAGDTVTAAELEELAGPRIEDVVQARGRGWAASADEVIPGLRSVAVPVRSTIARPLAPAVVYIGKADERAIATRLAHGAARLFVW